LPEVLGATACGALVPLPNNTLLAVNVVDPVPPLPTGRVSVTLVVNEQYVVDVDPVPPLATGRAVPDKVTASVPAPTIGDPVTVKKVGTDIATEVTLPAPDPAPIAVLKSAAFKAETVLSALNLGKVIALGFVNVYTFPPTVVAPRLVLAVAAEDAPVPPLATGTTPLIEAGVIATKSGVAKLLSQATITVAPVAIVTPVVGEVGPPRIITEAFVLLIIM
jgi:hypothetical protein